MDTDTGDFQAIPPAAAEALARVGEWAAHPLRWRTRQPPAAVRMLADYCRQAGAEEWAYGLGKTLMAMRDQDGTSDAELVDAALAMVAARMQVGLPDGEWFGQP